MSVEAYVRPNVRHAAVLANQSFRLLFIANLASGLGTWVALIALQVDVYDRTQSGWWVGALLIANLIPSIALGLLLGPLVDRLSRKWLMVASDLGRLAVFCVLPFASSAAQIVGLAVVAGVGNAFFRPAVLGRGAQPRLRRRAARCERDPAARRVGLDRPRAAPRWVCSWRRPGHTSPTG